MRRRGWASVAVAALVGLVGLGASTSPAGSPEEVVGAEQGGAPGVGRSVSTEPVCFEVTVTGDPVTRRVAGTRFHVGAVRAQRTAIVVVPSVTGQSTWDLRRDVSAARRLARAGYVVVTYDLLGYHRSPYGLPQGERLLSLGQHRSMLHEIVGQLRTGNYGVDGSCSARDGGAAAVGSERVVLMGHSIGGAVIGGYAAEHDDVEAVIVVGWSNQGLNPEVLQPGGAGYNALRQEAEGRLFLQFFRDDRDRLNRHQCERFLLHEAGVDPSVRRELCGRPRIGTIGETVGDFNSFLSTNVENQARIATGVEVPGLLVWGEHDWVFRPQDRRAEVAWWREHCRCELTSWTQPEAGHEGQAHRTMPQMVRTVVRWLRARGL